MILAGLISYLLLLGTANLWQFFSWTMGLLIVAVALPLSVTCSAPGWARRGDRQSARRITDPRADQRVVLAW